MGFKKTSDLIAISFSVTESAANTFTEEEIALQLDVLNNEIFVVQAIDLNPESPDAVAAANTITSGSLCSTTQTTVQTLGNTNCLADAQLAIRGAGYVDGGVGFSRMAAESYSGDLDYIGLIATNNFFVQIASANNAAAKTMAGRVWGYRAKADATTYAALVQSEVLSA
tara:strand:+ start:528 stop:1034 length:507 start_codon:yes stop_codon:yes gene_type:complete